MPPEAPVTSAVWPVRSNMLCDLHRLGTQIPSPPFRGEREGPSAERWEGEVGAGNCSGIPHLTPALSAPKGTKTGGERNRGCIPDNASFETAAAQPPQDEEI